MDTDENNQRPKRPVILNIILILSSWHRLWINMTMSDMPHQTMRFWLCKGPTRDGHHQTWFRNVAVWRGSSFCPAHRRSACRRLVTSLTSWRYTALRVLISLDVNQRIARAGDETAERSDETCSKERQVLVILKEAIVLICDWYQWSRALWFHISGCMLQPVGNFRSVIKDAIKKVSRASVTY